jgi:hypothetical protein
LDDETSPFQSQNIKNSNDIYLSLKRNNYSKESVKNNESMIYKEITLLKNDLFNKICIPLDLDVYLACIAWIYFEYLLTKGKIYKKNRILTLCVVFMLALKFYDIDDKKYLIII